MALYLRHPLSFEHDTGVHPENADRIRAIEARLDAVGWRGLEVREAPPASREQLERVHPGSHIEKIEQISAAGGGRIDLDTVASGHSYEAAPRAAGGAAGRGSRPRRQRRTAGVLRTAPSGPSRRARAGDGLLPL